MRLFISFFLIFFALSDFAGALVLQSDFLIFEGNKRTDNIVVKNDTSSQKMYKISFLEVQQLPDGALDIATEEPNMPLDSFLRISPKRFVMSSNSFKSLRVQSLHLSVAAGLSEGEYVRYLFVSEEGMPSVKNGSVPVQLGVPVIVRVGNVKSSLSFEGISLKMHDGMLSVEGQLKRVGQASTWGQFKVYDGDHLVGQLSDFALFNPNMSRSFSVNLYDAKAQKNILRSDFKKKFLRVEYHGNRDYGDDNDLVFKLPLN